MNLAYSNRFSAELDFLMRSDPARSIRESVDDMYSVGDIFCDTYTVKIVWLLLDSWFILCVYHRLPDCRSCGTSDPH